MKSTTPASLVLLVASSLLACGGGKDATGNTPPPVERVVGIPPGWSGSGAGYAMGTDRSDTHGGNGALYITSSSHPDEAFGVILQLLRADAYRGKRLRWSGWVKQVDLTGPVIGLWMRVDGPGEVASFDNMSARSLSGTSNWHQVSVVLDVPDNAIGIVLGVLMHGTGTLLVDDMMLEEVGSDVPVTNLYDAPQPGPDSSTAATQYARRPALPINTDFEGLPAVSQEAVAWLRDNGTPLATSDPKVELDDLDPLEAMIGSAHVVGLGEGTHGTREFFRMKHRILEKLVEDLGFTYFAIEGSSPEADELDHYVLTGQGDAAALLAGLHFWTWNTQEVLDMIQWMRDWNETAPAERQLHFLGFDMQYPGNSMDSVEAYVARVDPDAVAYVQGRYECLDPFRNTATSSPDPNSYSTLASTSKEACATALQEVYDMMTSRAASYRAASSTGKYDVMLHAARLVQQFEAMASVANQAAAASRSRDAAMAENVRWIRDHAEPDAKIVLWAHNGHVKSAVGTMGGQLRSDYGGDYVNLGFLFGDGSFNAINATNGQLQACTVGKIPSNSIEAIFKEAGKPLLLLDARELAGGGNAAAPLRGPIPARSIGAVFDPTSEQAYFYPVVLPDDFDLLIYVSTSTSSTLL